MTNESKISTIDDAPAPAVKAAVVKPGKAPVGTPELTGDKVTLTIHASNDFDGRECVPVGHNERVYQIPRGVPSVVPAVVAQIIKDAVVDRYDPGPNGQPVHTTSPRFAYTITPA